MQLKSAISFDDTAVAFSAKSDKQLRKAYWLFSTVRNNVLSSLVTGSVKVALKVGLPVKGIIKQTVFAHFCGGETIEDCHKTIEDLGSYGVGTILDYSVEGEETEQAFENTTGEIIKNVHHASRSKKIPFCVFKVTGIASGALLEKVGAKKLLSPEEEKAFQLINERIDRICKAGHALDVPILIDAEETWIQDPIDEIVYAMMEKYNREKAIVFNTYQMYRADMLGNLRKAFHYAAMHHYCLGAKLVRGAYMEKERERAEQHNYPSPIHPDKQSTDNAFDKALAFCIDNKQRVSVICGSHNEYSNYYLALLMEKHSMKNSDQRAWFAQLYGMSDNISFNLARAGYNVAKYVPYGPVKSVMPYLFRRAEENTSVAGQSGRELVLIKRELGRRRNSK